jgi:hypothetical protein
MLQAKKIHAANCVVGAWTSASCGPFVADQSWVFMKATNVPQRNAIEELPFRRSIDRMDTRH